MTFFLRFDYLKLPFIGAGYSYRYQNFIGVMDGVSSVTPVKYYLSIIMPFSTWIQFYSTEFYYLGVSLTFLNSYSSEQYDNGENTGFLMLLITSAQFLLGDEKDYKVIDNLGTDFLT